MRQARFLSALPTITRHARAAWALGIAAWAFMPAAHAADAATASVSISNVKITLVALDAEPWVNNTWPWIVYSTEPSWLTSVESTGVMADLTDAAQHTESNGWIGNSLHASVGSANASANASVTFSGKELDKNPAAALSFASASGGETASATANLWNAPFMLGQRSRLVVTMTVDGLSVAGNGGTATALASLGVWGPGGANFTSAEAQAIDSPDFSVAYSGPTTLSVSWDNPSSTDGAFGQISLLTSAQVLSAVAAPIPEPTTTALWLGGLVAVAGIARRRAKAAAAADMR